MLHYHLYNLTVTKLLPSTNLTPLRSLFVSRANSKGLSEPITYGRSSGADTLTPDGSLTMHMLLQGTPMPLTPGLTPVLGLQVNRLTTNIVTYVL